MIYMIGGLNINNENMKKINFQFNKQKLTLYYKITEWECGEYGACICYDTIFYATNKGTKKVKRYFNLFGPIVEIPHNEPIFELSGVNIESNEYTKEEIYDKIVKQLKLYYRQKEIDSGNIV